jgi:hypothetical protein
MCSSECVESIFLLLSINCGGSVVVRVPSTRPLLDDNIGTESEPIYGSVVVGTECAGAAPEDEKNKREN